MEARAWSCLVAGVGLALTLGSPAVGQEIKWAESYPDAKKLAGENGRLMMIDFMAEW